MIVSFFLLSSLLFSYSFSVSPDEVNNQVLAEVQQLVDQKTEEIANARADLDLADLLREVESLPVDKKIKTSLSSFLLRNEDKYYEFAYICDQAYAIDFVLSELKERRENGDISHYRYNVACKYLRAERASLFKKFEKMDMMSYLLNTNPDAPGRKLLGRIVKYGVLLVSMYGVNQFKETAHCKGIPLGRELGSVAFVIILFLTVSQVERDFQVTDWLKENLQD